MARYRCPRLNDDPALLGPLFTHKSRNTGTLDLLPGVRGSPSPPFAVQRGRLPHGEFQPVYGNVSCQSRRASKSPKYRSKLAYRYQPQARRHRLRASLRATLTSYQPRPHGDQEREPEVAKARRPPWFFGIYLKTLRGPIEGRKYVARFTSRRPHQRVSRLCPSVETELISRRSSR